MNTSSRERCRPQECPRYAWKMEDAGPQLVPWNQIERSETPALPWAHQLRDAADELALFLKDALNQSTRIEVLERDLAGVKEQLAKVGRACSFIIPINTFAPSPFEPIRPITALVEPVIGENQEPCEYIASFVDGVVSATGDTIEDALAMLKDRMVGQLTLLTKVPLERLGAIPRQQLAALLSVMRRIP